MLRTFICILALSSAGMASASDDVAAVTALTARFAEAQRNFDAPALRAMTSENYLEISPAGEFDERDKMLGFYAPEKKTAAPPVVMETEQTRLFGDVAVQSVKFNYTVPTAGEPRKFAIRATLVAHKVKGVWKMVSAHYTGVRPPKPN